MVPGKKAKTNLKPEAKKNPKSRGIQPAKIGENGGFNKQHGEN
jgi:hypothetical protein